MEIYDNCSKDLWIFYYCNETAKHYKYAQFSFQIQRPLICVYKNVELLKLIDYEYNEILNKFYQKDIYTIQQFQYKKEPKYQWTIKFFEQIRKNFFLDF